MLAPQVSRGADFGLGGAEGRQTAPHRLSRRGLVWLAPFLLGALSPVLEAGFPKPLSLDFRFL